MGVSLHVEGAISAQEADEIQATQVAGGIVEERILRARVSGVNAAILGACVPEIEGGIELDTGIGAGPGSLSDLAPEFGGLDSPSDGAIDAP